VDETLLVMAGTEEGWDCFAGANWAKFAGVWRSVQLEQVLLIY
jgi:hypothetical protein